MPVQWDSSSSNSPLTCDASAAAVKSKLIRQKSFSSSLSLVPLVLLQNIKALTRTKEFSQLSLSLDAIKKPAKIEEGGINQGVRLLFPLLCAESILIVSGHIDENKTESSFLILF